jgi:glyoxylase I family protein
MEMKLHHVAYRCKDARETVRFYTEMLGLTFAHAIRSETYRGKHCPFLHVFFRMADGSYIAFFELPEEPEQGWDPNTPRWVQHLALQVPDMETLMAAKQRLEDAGLEVYMRDGDTTIKSIYFFDPSGHRLELSVNRPIDAAKLERQAPAILDEWDRTRHQYKVKAAAA